MGLGTGIRAFGRALKKGRITPLGMMKSALEQDAIERALKKIKEFQEWTLAELRRLQGMLDDLGVSFRKMHITYDLKYESNLPEAQRRLEMAKIEVLYAWGQFIQSEATMRAPVQTGALRSSIAYRVLEKEGRVVVGSNMEYAPYVELGTSRNKSQPFLEPAIMENHQKLKRIAEEIYRKRLGGN